MFGSRALGDLAWEMTLPCPAVDRQKPPLPRGHMVGHTNTAENNPK